MSTRPYHHHHHFPPEQQNICIDSMNTCNLFSSTRTINQKSIKQSVRHRSDQHNAAAAWVRGPAWSLPQSVYLAAFGCWVKSLKQEAATRRRYSVQRQERAQTSAFSSRVPFVCCVYARKPYFSLMDTVSDRSSSRLAGLQRKYVIHQSHGSNCFHVTGATLYSEMQGQ